MEALSALNSLSRQRNQFKNQLDRQISEMNRDFTSENARTLSRSSIRHVSRTTGILEDINSRLFDAIHVLGHKAN